MDQILAVQSSEQEARSAPLLSHCTQLTPFYEGRGGETMQLQPAHMGEELCSLSQLTLHEGRMGQRVCIVHESTCTCMVLFGECIHVCM